MEALGELKDERAVFAILPWMNEYGFGVYAERVLVNMGNAAIPALNKALESEDENISDSATDVLMKIKSKQKK